MKRIFLLSIVAYLCASGFTSAETFRDYKYSDNGNGTCTITGYTGTGKDITIPSALSGLIVTGIGNYAFNYCTSLTSVIIPDSVTSIGDWSFFSCTSLIAITVDINNPAYTSADGVLFNKSQTTLIHYPAGLVGSYAIPDSVTSIGYSAFVACDNLTSVVIPDSVTSIGKSAFYSCTSLMAITVDTNNPAYTSADGVLFNKSQTTLIQYPEGLSGSYAIPDSVTCIGEDAFRSCTSLTSVVIPDSVTSIGDWAFSYCDSLTSVVIGDSVTSIGNYAFYSCTSLASVVIGDSVTSIERSAFYYCDSLTDVIIPDSVTSIGNRAFYFCDSLTSVIIGDSVTSIGEGAFLFCDSLMAITVDANNPAYTSADGVLFNKSQTTLIQYPAGAINGSYAIPDSVTWIEDEAFSFCTSLTSVVIPDSVTSIGEGAFRSCDSLTCVVIPDSVASIGEWAFRSCTSLTCVVIGDSVTGIGDFAFAYCTSLTGIFFKGTPPALGSGAFNGCQATVYYLAQNAASWPATFGGRPTAPWQLSVTDMNEDGNVDFFDFLTFAAAWQAVSGVDAAYNGDCDLAEPFGIIDTADLQLFANQWLISPCQ